MIKPGEIACTKTGVTFQGFRSSSRGKHIILAKETIIKIYFWYNHTVMIEATSASCLGCAAA
jgi:hypothetical protein